ncbi:MAG TPA: universal stress protein [Vicinamibacterales bacterium]|nr:universal stress protein [Vicinamibacterales bacterium]
MSSIRFEEMIDYHARSSRGPRPTKESSVVEFKHILCPIDLSDSSAAPLAYAVAFARWYGSRLTVLHVVPTFDPMQIQFGGLGDPVRIVQPVPREEVLEALRRAIDAAGAATIDATPAAEAGDAAPTIVDQAVALRADLIVLGTHGRSRFDRFLLGSVTEKVLRKAPCPILTVPPLAPATAPARVAFKRILCPMDFSPSAHQALGFALDLARQANGEVTVLHVIEWLAEEQARAIAHFNVAEYRRHLVDDAHERIRGLAAERPGASVEDLVVAGRAHREILETASTRESDLIVMGAQGRGGVGLTIFGSTTQQVVRAATCPVLTVRG